MVMTILWTIYVVIAAAGVTLALCLNGMLWSKRENPVGLVITALCWPLIVAGALFLIPVEKYRERKRSRRHGN